jgi:V8-like Glu-specific endopeptidase
METTDPHAPVSNSGGLDDTLPAAQPATLGKGKAAPAPYDDGAENVPGYVRPAAPEATAAAVALDAEDEVPANLPDIGLASFPPLPGLIQIEAIIGTDDRVQITDTTVYPNRAIASLLITAADGSQWVGTGWFISPRTLITAGHCVYIKNSGVAGRDGWARSITVMPGRNGNSKPFGQVVSKTFKTVSGWKNSGDEKQDYAAIIIPTPLGDTVGTFGFGVYTDADLMTATANISGYPGDKPGTQWFHARKVTSVGPQKVFYDVDTVGGQSGAPVWRVIGDQRIAIAVHAYGGATANSGTRITAAVNANLNAWKV